ncbi:MAG: hypothetical protein CMIDDMOC_00584 [Sodalis sp. Fle]|nr:MAG: hypothetical protein CMIDDMOC_00584 [Sodalis sp. Fle]
MLTSTPPTAGNWLFPDIKATSNRKNSTLTALNIGRQTDPRVNLYQESSIRPYSGAARSIPRDIQNTLTAKLAMTTPAKCLLFNGGEADSQQ